MSSLQDLAKPYDPKKSCWFPLKEEGGFGEGIIEQAEGDKVGLCHVTCSDGYTTCLAHVGVEVVS
jgi:hypothetical protein